MKIQVVDKDTPHIVWVWKRQPKPMWHFRQIAALESCYTKHSDRCICGDFNG